jgi:hypothetical protein
MVLPPKFSARAGLFCDGGVAMGKRDGMAISKEVGRRRDSMARAPLGRPMRSTANCSARRTAAGGGQAVDVLRAVQASICDSIRKQYAACSAVKVCCHAPSCFGRQWSRDPGRATRLVTAHHLFAATGTLSPRNTRAPAPLEPPLRRPLALEAPRDPSSLDPRSATAQHGAATALQAGEHAVCPSLTGAWRHGTDMEK